VLPFNITSRYGRLFSRWYDYFIAPAVCGTFTAYLDDLVETARPGDRILSIGCGGGQTEVEAARRRADIHITGVDLAEPHVEAARRRAARAGVTERTSFVQGDALRLPFPSESFDYVFSAGSLKHWPDKNRGLMEARRVLRPGCRLLMTEVDRSARFADIEHWLERTRIPARLRPVFGLYFRSYIAGQSLALDDAEALLESLELVDQQPPQRVPQWPIWSMSGRKPEAIPVVRAS
jgi:ubiquinone/menaquinone biosynthesis C-methylase UbiE